LVDIPYCVVLTKADAFVNRWSNLVENFKVHINNVPADRTMCVENYKADRSRRSGEVDRNLLYIFFKFLTFAEESLLFVTILSILLLSISDAFMTGSASPQIT